MQLTNCKSPSVLGGTQQEERRPGSLILCADCQGEGLVVAPIVLATGMVVVDWKAIMF